MNFSRNLPIGIQDFEKLRTNNFLYVDKTEYVYKLARLKCPYFLSRPRRFGKSLFLSTLEAYFLGKKDCPVKPGNDNSSAKADNTTCHSYKIE